MSKITLITKKTEVITLKTGPRGPQGIKGDKGDQGDVTLAQLNTKADKTYVDAQLAEKQQQIDILVVSGDSSPAADQARVDANGILKDSLKTRLDDDYNEVNARLAEISYSMKALKGDGVTDDSAAIQSILNKAGLEKVKKVIFPKSVYRMDSPVFAIGDTVEIDFSGSEILSYANAVSGNKGEMGIINFHGELINGNILNYIRLGSTPAGAPELLTYQSVKETTGLTTFTGGKITTSNNATFSVGDNLLIRGWVNPNGTNNYNKDLYQPELTVVAKVLKKDSTHIFIDYYSPLEYPAFVQGVSKSIVLKVNLKKNTKLKNVTIIDNAPLETTNGIPTTGDRVKALCPVSAILCDDIQFENVKVKNHRGNGIFPFYCRDIKIKNVEAENARLFDGGLGYLTQIIGCRDIEVDNVKGIKCRHVVDLSWSSYANVKNVKSFDSIAADLDVHGLCEHDITFENCEGYALIGNGIQYFPNIAKNIKFINCNIEMFSLIGNATIDTHFIDGVLIKGGKLKINHLPMFMNLTIEDVKIDWTLNPFVTDGINKRGQTIFAKTTLKYCSVDLGTSGTIYDLYLPNNDDIVIDNVDFKFKNLADVWTDGIRIRNLGGSDLTIVNSKLNELRVRFNSSRPKSKLVISENTVSYTKNQNRFIEIAQLSNCDLLLVAKHNTFKHSGTAAQFFILVAANIEMTNSKVSGVFDANILQGNANAKIHYIHSGVVDPAKAKIYIQDANNVVEHRDPAGSNLLSTTRNLIIS